MEPDLKIDSAGLFNYLKDNNNTVTLAKDTITLSGSKYSNTVIGGGYAVPPSVTVSAGTGLSASPWSSTSYPWLGNGVATDGTTAGKIILNGDKADVEINGISLSESIRKIEERLNILVTNPKLEAEWEELRVLGNQYRDLEKHIKEKQATWDRLTAMPPPKID